MITGIKNVNLYKNIFIVSFLEEISKMNYVSGVMRYRLIYDCMIITTVNNSMSPVDLFLTICALQTE